MEQETFLRDGSQALKCSPERRSGKHAIAGAVNLLKFEETWRYGHEGGAT